MILIAQDRDGEGTEGQGIEHQRNGADLSKIHEVESTGHQIRVEDGGRM